MFGNQPCFDATHANSCVGGHIGRLGHRKTGTSSSRAHNRRGALVPSQNFKTRRFSHLEECHVLVAVLLFICSSLCHSCNFSSSFESFLVISVAWDQAPPWRRKEKNDPVFAFFLHCGALSQATISFALSVACRNFIDSVYRGPQGKTDGFCASEKQKRARSLLAGTDCVRDTNRKTNNLESKTFLTFASSLKRQTFSFCLSKRRRFRIILSWPNSHFQYIIVIYKPAQLTPPSNRFVRKKACYAGQ